MQAIRQTQLLNKRELESATPPSASWHADYRDTAWIYIGGLLPELSEGDVSIIFSQFGNPTHLNLIRDKETGKSKGFGFLKYEDQRSCDLAVDNLGGAEVMGRMLRVDHSRYKKKKKRDGEDEEDEDTYRIEIRERQQFGGETEDEETEAEDDGDRKRRKRRKLLKEEVELQEMLAIEPADGEEQDPMRDFLIREKREEVETAKAREKERRKHKHKHKHRTDADGMDEKSKTRHRHHRRDEPHSGDERDRRRGRDDGYESKTEPRRREASDEADFGKYPRSGNSVEKDRGSRRDRTRREDDRSKSRSRSRSPRRR
ncbi:U2 snRNP component ist3 [Cyphellophora attinorum]|uniref:U2 snRNP component ist3 n=1 Tax=Cyphellophora attinorum TaxID=1664694 RepID=A0A0N0NP56_9EURO|nr:U2 snRNP component ist3 [Phialophora attinorum]KPI42371.1 U2 snRNP component ist3 [Phialophora attinorum]